jgi:hypothetical protein
MPRDSSGTYTASPSSPFVTGTPIAATVANTRASDVATEITDSLSRSGKGGMLAPLVFTGIAATIRSGIANGASAVAHILDSVASLTTVGAKLLSLRNAGVEKASVDKDGTIVTSGDVSAATGYVDALSTRSAATNTIYGRPADGATAVGVVLDAATALANAAAKLLSIRNAGVEKLAIGEDGAIIGGAADGATAVGVILDTANALTTSGAKILSVRNAGTERISLSKDGSMAVTSAAGVAVPALWATGRGSLGGVLGSNLANGPGVTADVTTGTGERGALNLTPQAAPSAPQNGDMWVETGTNTLKVRINGVTKTVTLT